MLKRLKDRLTTALCTNPLSLPAALARCRQRVPRLGTVLDVGASNGSWSLQARKLFPEAACFMIEAQEEHGAALTRLTAGQVGMDFLLAAAGDRDGSVYFQEGDLFGGVAAHQPAGPGFRQVPMVALDTVVRSRGLTPPFLLKLDTHGFELPILEGARETLTRTALLVVETYNFQLTPESLRFHEMCAYLERHGFRCVDLCDPLFRVKDGAFWQMDLFFMPDASEPFQSDSYA
jgi:FkbM family methyltransferase